MLVTNAVIRVRSRFAGKKIQSGQFNVIAVRRSQNTGSSNRCQNRGFSKCRTSVANKPFFLGACDRPGSATAAPRTLASRSCTVQARLKTAAPKNLFSYMLSLVVVRISPQVKIFQVVQSNVTYWDNGDQVLEPGKNFPSPFDGPRVRPPKIFEVLR